MCVCICVCRERERARERERRERRRKSKVAEALILPNFTQSRAQVSKYSPLFTYSRSSIRKLKCPNQTPKPEIAIWV